MSTSQNMMKVIEHIHPLKLIDLHVNVNVEDVEESDEEEKDFVQDEFSCTCERCDQDINEYYRYYYKCIEDSCEFSLHKFCAELPATLKHISHPHLLSLKRIHPFISSIPIPCHHCGSNKAFKGVCYYCSFCYIQIDVNCCVEVEKRKIYHPSHPHPLVSPISNPIICFCKACEKEHKGVFFQCTICTNFAIHTDCAFLPKSLFIQQTSNGTFHHTHPLTLSYSFPIEDQEAKYYPKCRACGGSFSYRQDLWNYKCEKCIYYAHVDCTTSRREPFMSILSIGKGPTVKNFKDVDYPKLLCLPFPDETYSIPKQFTELGRPITSGTNEVSLQHINHQHKLIFVDTECIGSTSSKSNSLVMCHNPMKKIQLLCNVCVKPIMEMPFYKCAAKEDENCNFAIHDWCTRLPTKVDNHPGHPQHTLVLMSNVSHKFFNTFYCVVCCLPCNGSAYGCVKCEYYIDVSCGLLPETITHKSHPDHLLKMVKAPAETYCHMCRYFVKDDDYLYVSYFMGHRGSEQPMMSFSCNICDVYIHVGCATLLPQTIRHPYDKHPMHLSYLPMENHKGAYFCEICEEKLNPHASFYRCDVCVQSVHCACAPLTLQCETETYNYHSYPGNIYWFQNVKFGSIHKTNDHPHPLSFTQGIELDGKCDMCCSLLQYDMILKCLECQFAIHCKC